MWVCGCVLVRVRIISCGEYMLLVACSQAHACLCVHIFESLTLRWMRMKYHRIYHSKNLCDSRVWSQSRRWPKPYLSTKKRTHTNTYGDKKKLPAHQRLLSHNTHSSSCGERTDCCSEWARQPATSRIASTGCEVNVCHSRWRSYCTRLHFNPPQLVSDWKCMK